MDSLNGVAYDDDRQIAKLDVVKVYDSEGEGTGGIDLVVRVLNPEDLLAAASRIGMSDM